MSKTTSYIVVVETRVNVEVLVTANNVIEEIDVVMVVSVDVVVVNDPR